MKDITGIVVSHNTLELLQNAYESVRKFHPDMKIIIIDGSDKTDPCYLYARSLASDITTVYAGGYNIGHGRGMDMAIGICETRFALIFDSDIVMHKSPIQKMLDMMEEDTYGVGYTEKTAYDGHEYGHFPEHKDQPFMYMLHPFFQLLQISEYYKFHKYVHHGSPCYKAALDIHKQGLTDKIIKCLPGLGHTHGKGIAWSAVPGEWIKHDTAGTRKERVRRGQAEIEPWEEEKKGTIVLITPTGARKDQFELCVRWMKNQTYTGAVTWIIIDDAVPVTTDIITEDFRENWTIIKTYPEPTWEVGQNTQERNTKAGLETMRNNCDLENIEAIFIIEDDDYYKPYYLEKMMMAKQNYWIWGETNTIYYNVVHRNL